MTRLAPASIDRRDVLARLFPDAAEWLFVSGLAGAAKDTAALTGDGPNLYSMAGTMGAAVPMGLGLAVSAPESRVAVVTGDGELLMGIGALVTVASAGPANLTVVCIDNSMHGETGGQQGHTAGTADLELIARGSGIASTLTISEPGQVGEARAFITEAPGPRMLVVRVLPTAPSVYKRNMDPASTRVRFRQGFLGNP